MTINCIPALEIILIYRDNGPGVKSEKKPKIFDPFFTTKKGEIGIGLTDAKEIIESHYGSIVENGKVGKGVQFEIRIPCRIETGDII